MPASLPGATAVENAANPTQGTVVNHDLLSGPKNSPLDSRKIASWSGTMPTYANDPTNVSTGALSTGIGFGSNAVLGPGDNNTPRRYASGNFTDDYTPGVTKPDGTAAPNATYMYAGGGRSNANGTSNPYTAGFGVGAAGQGGARDAGAGPAYTGFPPKLVTGAAANGDPIETGFNNRSGVALTNGQSAFGVGTTASAAPVLAEEGEQP